jgi:DNA-directed RNA polymerase-3 subunit RPC5
MKPPIYSLLTATANTAATMEDDEDPVIAEYDVFITPEMHEQIYVLQYLNRDGGNGLRRSNNSGPLQLRVKEQSGFVEVDIPMDIRKNFSRPAGVKWGEALRKTKGFGQKAYGISSGFERVMPRPSRAGAAGTNGTPAPVAIEDDDNLEEWVTHFEDANEKGHVLNTQTFGGQIAKEDGKGPSYMLGTFRDSACALFPTWVMLT